MHVMVSGGSWRESFNQHLALPVHPVCSKNTLFLCPIMPETIVPLAGTTWADRSNKETIPTRPARAKVTDDAVKRINALRTQQTREKNMALAEDLVEFTAQRDKLIEELAKRHSKKPHAIKAILNHGTQFKKRRAPNLQNALVHAKAMELAEGTLYPLSLPCIY